MPYPEQLAVQLDAINKQSIIDKLHAIIEEIKALQNVNLSAKERRAAGRISHKRLPYVENCMNNLVVLFPQLIPGFHDINNVRKDFENANDMREIVMLASQLIEIASDMGFAAERLVMKFTGDFYDASKRSVNRNVPGSDVAVEALAPLFQKKKKAKPSPQ